MEGAEQIPVVVVAQIMREFGGGVPEHVSPFRGDMASIVSHLRRVFSNKVP